MSAVDDNPPPPPAPEIPDDGIFEDGFYPTPRGRDIYLEQVARTVAAMKREDRELIARLFLCISEAKVGK